MIFDSKKTINLIGQFLILVVVSCKSEVRAELFFSMLKDMKVRRSDVISSAALRSGFG